MIQKYQIGQMVRFTGNCGDLAYKTAEIIGWKSNLYVLCLEKLIEEQPKFWFVGKKVSTYQGAILSRPTTAPYSATENYLQKANSGICLTCFEKF